MQLRPLLSTCLAGLALWMVAGSFAGKARADLLPQCDMGSALITCAAADEGKPCQGGGTCYAISCSSSAATPGLTKVYRCDACPTIVSVPTDTCQVGNLGTACGDGGAAVCGAIQPYCNTTSDKFVCQIAATAMPTGAPTGAAGTSGTDAGTDATGAAGTTGGAGTTGAAGSGTGAPATTSGCDVAPRPSPTSLIGLGLVVVGLLFFAIDRRRRRR
jgi:hypothetical protein